MNPLMWTIILFMLIFLLTNMLNNFSSNQNNAIDTNTLTNNEISINW